MQRFLLILSILCLSPWPGDLQAQQLLPEVVVDVNLDLLHETGGVGELDRTKFITFHSPHWAKDLLDEPEMFSYLVNDLDVGFGRDMGKINWDLNQVAEDQSRPGYPSYLNMVAKGNEARNWYAGLTVIHALEEKSSLIVCPPVHPFWPNTTPTNPNPCCGGTSYTLADVSATAELFANWLNLYHGGDGMPLPAWFEVINEPLWQMVDNNGIASIDEIFQYHNDLAAGIRSSNAGVALGGYATAIPAFEKDNFGRWEDRWKSFIDLCGANMDFYSLHFYDVYNNSGQKQFRKGGNLEATFDMIEQYSTLALDTIKPFVISEFCAQTNHMRETPWTPYRDWLQMKSITPMWLSFMDRPHLVDKAVPFVVLKATWYNSEYPYQHRLMRQANEMEGQEGDHWVFTEFIKVYELWAGVKGRRVDSHATDPDILCDAWVDQNEVHIVMSNLEFGLRTVALALHRSEDREVESVTVKHLRQEDQAPVLDTTFFDEIPEVLTLAPEGSMAISITFAGNDSLAIPGRSVETKYYADEYLREIRTGMADTFHIRNVLSGEYGEGLLRLGMGRDHGSSLRPEVWFNGTSLEVPEDLSGDSQEARERFFGLLEIRVPNHLISTENEIAVTFPDDGGHISSTSLRVFASTSELHRSAAPGTFNAAFSIRAEGTGLPLPGSRVIFAGDTAYSGTDGMVFFDSIPGGSYQIEVDRQGYETFGPAEVKHVGNTTMEIRLKVLSHHLSFKVIEKDLQVPAGNILIDAGNFTAYTDASGEASMQLNHGSIPYRLTHPYFESLSDTISLDGDSTLELEITRLKAEAKFIVTEGSTGSRLRDALISLNDTSISTNTLGLATFRGLTVDTAWVYQVEREGYTGHEGELLLKQDSTIRAELLTTGTGSNHPDGPGDTDGLDDQLRIYPNPASKELFLDLMLTRYETVRINILDLKGRKLQHWLNKGIPGLNHMKLQLDGIPEGCQILLVETWDSTLIRRINILR